MADKGVSLFSIRGRTAHNPKCRTAPPVVIPAKAGPKATPTGGPEQSRWVSVAHNPKCWKHLYVVIPAEAGIQDK